MVKAELKIDQLVLELQSKERDLFNERNELEKVYFKYFEVLDLKSKYTVSYCNWIKNLLVL